MEFKFEIISIFKVGELFGCDFYLGCYVYILNIFVEKFLKVKIVSNMYLKYVGLWYFFIG